jgi:hypothetical protein
MNINISKALKTKGFTIHNFGNIIKSNPNLTLDLILHPDDYETINVRDFLELINICKLDIEEIVIDDYLPKAEIENIIYNIKTAPEDNVIKQNWKWEDQIKENGLNWPLMFLKDISDCFKVSLIYLIQNTEKKDSNQPIQKGT